MRYTIEYLTVNNTWEVFATNFTYQDAVSICFDTICSYEMQTARMVEEK